ncbi:MAG: type II toxin-antitoxin system HicB family antitoxin [Thermosynechococcaceae cyanobacterium]
MLSAYIQAAMQQANYELLADGTFYGEIPDFQGVWANEDHLESCRSELQATLEDWLLVRVADHLPVPTVDGLKLIAETAA